MNKLGGGGLLLTGIVMVILGALIMSPILEWLLDVIGIIIIVAGVVVVVVGIIGMLTGRRDGARDF